MIMTAHPAILGLGNSLAPEATFPLIMVVGREPNADHAITLGTGRYGFWPESIVDEGKCAVTNCGFWNTTYTVMARVVGSSSATGRIAKERCRPMQLSPVIFSDALPRGLPNKVSLAMKNAFRDSLQDNEIREHVNCVFSHKAIVARVRIVLLSGLSACDGLRRASAIFEDASRSHGIPAQSIPFMYGTNTSQIIEAITSKNRNIINQIWDSLP